ncbi:hypothetical protein K4K59_013229 [Colletotrichum sp. SAR11_240]|nr:hypothetical protein K4K59_013229 [Colletotrichum sp. SAR11_240]
MAHGKHVKKPWYLKNSLDDYFVDDRAATVDRDPEANFVPGVAQYADDEYKGLQLPPNSIGRPKNATTGTNIRVSQRQAARKATERTSMLFEEYGKIVDEDEASSEEESRVTRRGPEKEAEEFVATIRPHRQDLADDREVTLGREIVGTADSDIAKVGKVEEIIHVAVAPATQAAPVRTAPPQPTPLEAPGPAQSRSGNVPGHDGEETQYHKTNEPNTSAGSRSASVESRISSISLQWAQVEEIIVHERFVNAAYLTMAGLRASIVDDLARELGIIDYADITDHLNEIRHNPHDGARVEAARALGRLVMDRMIVAGIKSE